VSVLDVSINSEVRDKIVLGKGLLLAKIGSPSMTEVLLRLLKVIMGKLNIFIFAEVGDKIVNGMALGRLESGLELVLEL